MRAYPAVILVGVLAALLAASAAQAEVQRSHLGVVYTDAEERFSVRFPKEWDEVDSRIVRQLLEDEDFWPYDTAVLYLDLDRERYTCPCVWLARLPNRSLEMDLMADLSAEVYEIASLEKVAEAGRVPPLHESRYNCFSTPIAAWCGAGRTGRTKTATAGARPMSTCRRRTAPS